MKDYRLSEMLETCKRRQEEGLFCDGCGCEDFCQVMLLYNGLLQEMFEKLGIIEPRDMIELPCKDYVFFKDEEDEEEYWIVYYRNTEFNCIDCKYFETEAEADAFFAELKGEK